MLFYVKDGINCNKIEWSRDFDLECIGLKETLSEQMSFSKIGIYRPPSARIVFYNELKALISESESEEYHCKNQVILLGDFNFNLLDIKRRD